MIIKLEIVASELFVLKIWPAQEKIKQFVTDNEVQGVQRQQCGNEATVRKRGKRDRGK